MTANLFVLYLKFRMHFIRNDMMLLLGVLHLSVLSRHCQYRDHSAADFAFSSRWQCFTLCLELESDCFLHLKIF